jgi:four helix bundle protein
MSEIRSYRDLQVWQRSMELCVHLYRLTESFPNTEHYGLTGQMRRAAVSIPSNIAEGHRRPTRDFARFLAIALGSAAELSTQIEIAQRIGYLSLSDCAALQEEIAVLERQLNNLTNRLRD